MIARAAALGLALTGLALSVTPATAQDHASPQKLAGQAGLNHPQLNHDELLARPHLIRTYPAGEALRRGLAEFFRAGGAGAGQSRVMRYAALDVGALRDANPASAGKRYMVLRNRTGQFQVVDLAVYLDYEPVIVVGLDDETNLFRLARQYRNLQRYSWVEDARPIPLSAEPLGAFLHFRKPLPAPLFISFVARSKLRLSSITFTRADPLSRLGKLPAGPAAAVVTRNCIICHRLNGIGGRAFHLNAATGRAQSWAALDLRDYPEPVLRAFLFDQERVARSFAMTPNILAPDVASALLTYLTQPQ